MTTPVKAEKKRKPREERNCRRGKKYRRSIRIGPKVWQATFSKKANADLWYAQMVEKKEKIVRGIDIGFEAKTFEQWSGLWLCGKEGTIEESTFETYNGFLKNHLLPSFKDEYLHLMSSNEIQNTLLKVQRAKNLANATYNRLRSLLNEIFEDAKRNRPQFVTDNPIERVRKLIEPDGSNVIILTDPKDIDRYISGAWHTISPPFWMAVMIFLNTGARLGEVLAITRADIDFLHLKIRINKQRVYRTGKVKPYTKGKRNRSVDISEALLAALVFWFEFDAEAADDDCIVRWIKAPEKGPWKNDGRPFSPSHTHFLHDALCTKLGLPSMTLHALRHSYATLELDKNKDIRHLQRQLGHQDMKTTQRYLGLIEMNINKKETLSLGKGVLDEIRKLKLVKAE
jgi:integrase